MKTQGIGRRSFLEAGTSLLTAGLAAAGSPRAHAESARPYAVKWYPFTEHPESDTCWSLSVGPDGRIYAASCAESVPGGVVKPVRYNEQTDRLDFLFNLAEKVEDPGDTGHATQCKIHYSFAPSMADGVLYMATHLSGPPIDLPVYNPWYSWHDEKRLFRGAALLAFDTRTDRVLWWDTLIPKEGCRCLLHDEERRLLYALSYPRDHFIIYDLASRKRRDIGRIGSINGQTLFLDKKHRVWTTNDYGHLVRYTPDTGRLEISPSPLPHAMPQTGWHSVFYDVAPSPDRECVYASTWCPNPYLVRIWPNEGEWPRVESLGPATQPRDLTLPANMFLDHCGGLTFAGDGKLYYVASRWRDPDRNPMPPPRKAREGVVWRLDPETLQREEVARLEHPTGLAQYVSRGAVDHNGDLFFGHVGERPSGIFKVSMPAERKRKNAHLPVRMWG
ncbi:MAG TPA: hypothetical protein VHA11_10280 [Bryobacteraceae bacterium]|nr:hypothetical protein [Bryobacteraceae bacterium]